MKLIDCRKKRKQEKFKKSHLSLQSSSSLLLYTHFVYRLESITKWDYRIIKCYAMASISHYSRIHSHSALINGHSFSAIFFLFSVFSSPFCLFASAWHFASCAITKYSHCTVDVSAWRASTLYRSLHTISKIFWPSFGDDLISSLSLSVECGRGSVGAGAVAAWRQGRRFVACTGFHVLFSLSPCLAFSAAAFNVFL